MPEIISRKEAMARGLKRYFTGKPCKFGHVDERTCSSLRCLECSRVIAKSEGEKLRRRLLYANSSKVRLSQKLRSKAWVQANPHKMRSLGKKWRENRTDRQRDLRRISKRKYNLNGPQNPKGEIGWLRKNRAQLRSVKRLLKRLSHGQHPSPNSAFTTPTDSPK